MRAPIPLRPDYDGLVLRRLARASAEADQTRRLTALDRASEAILSRREVGLVASSYLRLLGLISFAAAWSRLEAAAESAPNPERIRAVAAFVRDWMLPEVEHLAERCRTPHDIESLSDKVFAP